VQFLYGYVNQISREGEEEQTNIGDQQEFCEHSLFHPHLFMYCCCWCCCYFFGGRRGL